MHLIVNFFRNRLSLFVFLLLSFMFVAVKIHQVRENDKYISESNAIAYDVYGYYLHLPATIIHRDPGLTERSWLDALNNKYQKSREWYQAWPGINNRMVNVYPVGHAICNLPFFLVAHISAGWMGYERDGLSPPYQVMIIFAALFYAILGMWMLRKILLRYFSDILSATVLFSIGIGTNLYYYAIDDVTMPHITLFCFGTLILLITIKWHETPKPYLAAMLGVLIGLVAISRPTEIVWILIPLFWGVDGLNSLKTKMVLLKKHFGQVVLFSTTMVAVGSIQLIYWKYTSGHWFSNNHVEGFDFFRPFTIDVLFSYKKGWLLYTPMMILSIIGLFLMFKRERKLFVPFFIFFIMNLWFISSWECWWYGASFGQRPFVESYGLMAIPLGFFLRRFNETKINIAITGFILFLIVFLNQFQIWQMRREIFHYELMTKEYYWEIFGKRHVDSDSRKLLEVDRFRLAPLDKMKNNYVCKTVLKLGFETSEDNNFIKICDTLGSGSKKSEILDDINLYSAAYKKSFDSITNKNYVRVRLAADVFLSSDFVSKPTHIVFTMIGSRNQNYSYKAVMIDSVMAKPNQWCRIHADYTTPYILHRDDKFLVFIWNEGGAKTLIDNLEIEIYEPK